MKSRPAPKAARRPPALSFSLHGSAEISAAEDRFKTRAAWVLAALFAAALIAMVAGPHRIGDYMTETDFYGDYARGARLVQQGRIDPSRYGVVGPGYEIALALTAFVVRDFFLAAELLSVAAMTATLLLWFFVLRRRAGPRVAIFAALFLATNGHFFHYGYSATTDALALALQALALYFLLAVRGRRALLAAGALSAAAFLTRYNAVYLLPAGLIAALLGATGMTAAGTAPAASEGGERATGASGAPPAAQAPHAAPPAARPGPARMRAALEFAAGFFLPVVPWVLYSLAHGGSFSLQLHHNIAYEVFARAKGIPWDTYQSDLQPQFKSLMDVIRRDPGAVFGRMIFNLWDHLRLDATAVIGWPLAIAGLVGLGLGARDGTLRRLWPLWVAGALLFLTLVPAFHSPRYSIALVPVYATLGALAFGSPLFAFAIRRGKHAWLKPVLATLPIGFALDQAILIQERVVDQLPTEVLDCAATLRELKREGDRLIARKWHLAYHAGVEALPFPFAESLPDLARYAHENRVRWLFFSWPEAETRPRFYHLLDTAGVVPGLTPRHVTAPHPAVLYEIGPDFGRIPSWFANDTIKSLHRLRAQLMVEGDNPKMLAAYARILGLSGRSGQARVMARRAVQVAPDDTEVLMTAAGIAFAQQDVGTALALMQRAAAIDPGNARIRIGLGLAQLQAGRERDAAVTWRPVIEACDDPAVLSEMARLFGAAGDRDAERRARQRLAQPGAKP